MGIGWQQDIAAVAAVVAVVAAVAAVAAAVVAAFKAGRSAKSAEAAVGEAVKAATDELYERLRTNDFAHVHKEIRRLDAKIDSTREQLEARIDRVDARVGRVDDRLKETRVELTREIRASEARLLEAIRRIAA